MYTSKYVMSQPLYSTARTLSHAYVCGRRYAMYLRTVGMPWTGHMMPDSIKIG